MANQTISTTVAGPIFSNGGAITVTNTGKINGGPTGVDAKSFSITTLSNSGSIGGANGAPGGAGGTGVRDSDRLACISFRKIWISFQGIWESIIALARWPLRPRLSRSRRVVVWALAGDRHVVDVAFL
jgi:hypothetical protein